MGNIIDFDVYRNTLRKTGGLSPVSSESAYSKIVCHFKEGDDWDIFNNNDGVITAGFYVTAENVFSAAASVVNRQAEFSIPGQLVGNINSIYFGIAGSFLHNGSTVTIATNVIELDVARGVVISGSSDAAADNNFYSQFIATVNAAIAAKMNKLGEGSAGMIILSDGSNGVDRSIYSIATSAADGSFNAGVTNKVPTVSAVEQRINGKGFLTAHQDISGKEDKSNKVTSLSASSTDIQYPSAKAVYGALEGKANSNHSHQQYLTSHQDITGKEDKSNKVTSLSESATDAQYPSAKAVYDALKGKADTSGLPDFNSMEYVDDKVSVINDSPVQPIDLVKYTSVAAVKGYLSDKVATSMSASSTDAQYPSAKAVYDALEGKANTNHTHSQYLTSHQSLAGLIGTDKVYEILDSALSGDPSNIPALLVDNTVDQTHNPDGHYILYYIDSDEVRHNIFDISEYFVGKTSELQNDSGFMPIVEVSSIDSCTEEKVLYRVKIGNYTASYIFNVIHPDIWGQFKIDVNSGGVLYRAKLRAYPDAPWGQFDDFIAFEDTFYKVTSLTAQSTDEQYPSAKAVYDALSGKANASHSHTGMENTSNKVTSISSSSTDNQYPTAKCVYDLIGDIETLLSQV